MTAAMLSADDKALADRIGAMHDYLRRVMPWLPVACLAELVASMVRAGHFHETPDRFDRYDEE